MFDHFTYKTIIIFNQKQTNLRDSWLGDSLFTNDKISSQLPTCEDI